MDKPPPGHQGSPWEAVQGGSLFLAPFPGDIAPVNGEYCDWGRGWSIPRNMSWVTYGDAETAGDPATANQKLMAALACRVGVNSLKEEVDSI